MQKQLLMLFMVVHCAMVQAGDYTDDLIVQYQEALVSGNVGMIDKVYNDQKSLNEARRLDARCHQCNGRHLSQPDEHSVAGREHRKIEEDHLNNTMINDQLYEGYKNNFNVVHKLEHKIYVLKAQVLESLEICGNDKSCLIDRLVNWEDVSSPDRLDRFCSSVYDAVLLQGKIVLTQDQRLKSIENDLKLKELDAKLNNAKKDVKDKIESLNK